MKTNLFLFILFGLSLISVLGNAEEYTFTNKADQKNITAEVKSIAAGKVAIEKDGKTFQIPVTKLIDEDIAFLKQWLVRNPSYTVRMMVSNKKGQSPEGDQLQTQRHQTKQPTSGYRPPTNYNNQTIGTTTYNTGATASSEEFEHFRIAVTNDSTVTLKDATIKYSVYIQNKKSKNFQSASNLLETRTGTIDVPEIPPGKTAYLHTQTIVLQNLQSQTITTTTQRIPTTSNTGISNTNSINDPTNTVTSVKRKTHRFRPEVDSITVYLYKDGKILKKVEK